VHALPIIDALIFAGCPAGHHALSEASRTLLHPQTANRDQDIVLTLADMDHFIESGGMIQFLKEDSRVRSDIAVGATSRAWLKVSAKLLSLTHTFTGTERVGNN
jgi:hypothetical protein